jgi:hypothetical protein
MSDWRKERFVQAKTAVDRESGWNTFWSGANKERANEKNTILKQRDCSRKRVESKEPRKHWGDREASPERDMRKPPKPRASSPGYQPIDSPPKKWNHQPQTDKGKWQAPHRPASRECLNRSTST